MRARPGSDPEHVLEHLFDADVGAVPHPFTD